MPPCKPETSDYTEKSSAADYVWLAYTIFFFFEPIARNSRPYWLKCIALFVPFLATYIALVAVRRRRTRVLLLVLLTAEGLLGMSFNGGASCFITFASAFAPFILETTSAVIICLLTQLALVLLEGRFLHLEWITITIAIVLISIVGTTNLFIAQKKRNTAVLLRAQEEIEQLAALAERERIARDMHDVLGHTLSVIVLKSELAGRLLARIPTPVAPSLTSTPVILSEAQRSRRTCVSTSEPDPTPEHHSALTAALAEIADIEATARKALADVREAIGGYRAQGLPAEIDLARRTLLTAGVALTTELTPNLRLSPTEETALSLALREAVTNVIRHARATACDLRVTTSPTGGHTLTLIDNGTALAATIPREGNGLRGMRERISALGGTLTLTPAPTGTTLRIDLPNPTPSASSQAASDLPAATLSTQPATIT